MSGLSKWLLAVHSFVHALSVDLLRDTGKYKKTLINCGFLYCGAVTDDIKQTGEGAAMAVPVFGRGFADGRNKKTPLRVFVMLVAGAGFEPTTFGL